MAAWAPFGDSPMCQSCPGWALAAPPPLLCLSLREKEIARKEKVQESEGARAAQEVQGLMDTIGESPSTRRAGESPWVRGSSWEAPLRKPLVIALWSPGSHPEGLP